MRNIFILLLICSLNIVSCKGVDTVDIAGNYKLDKVRKLKEVHYNFPPILTLNADQTFSLQKDILIKGKWEFVKFDNKSAIIKFCFDGQEIISKIEKNVIYFEYPNDFDNGSYRTMLYVRTTETQ